MTSQMKKIEKSIDIHAAKEQVWEVLTNNQLNAIWYEPFSTGTHTDTDWQTGSPALFVDGTGSGLISKVIVNNPFTEISLEHQGIVNNGVEEYDSEMANYVKGGLENYYLSEQNGVTKLSIAADMAPDYFDSMAAAWDKALEIISRLSRTGSNH